MVDHEMENSFSNVFFIVSNCFIVFWNYRSNHFDLTEEGKSRQEKRRSIFDSQTQKWNVHIYIAVVGWWLINYLWSQCKRWIIENVELNIR